MTKINKIKNILVKFFFIVMIILFSLMLFKVIFKNDSAIIHTNPIILLIMVSIFIGIYFGIYQFFNKYIKTEKLFITILFTILVITQVIFICIFHVEPVLLGGWDFGAVHTIAMEDVLNHRVLTDYNYLYIFDNNVGIVLLLKFFYTIAHFLSFNHFVIVGLILNMIFIDIAIFFLYKIMKKFLDVNLCHALLLFTIFFSPFITYTPIFYTDTLSLPFAISSIYFLTEYFDKRKTRYLILSGLLIGLGSFIKITVVITFIAMIIFYLFKEEKDNFIQSCKQLGIVFIILIIPIAFLKCYININFDQKKMNEFKFPTTHWVMMGMHGLGGFYQKDQEYTSSFNSIEAKKDANIDVIKKRLNNYIEKGTFLHFIAGKENFIWGDGTFYALKKLERHPATNYDFKKYVLESETNNNYIFKAICQAQWVLVLLFMIIGMVLRKYLSVKQRDLQLLLNIVIMGIFLFLTIWEARSRYIVNFLPVILLSSYLGVMALINYIQVKKNSIIKDKK